ncbi:MAG: methylenetetrahydrofolate reductase [NAD(P)H] [Clostridium sp.]|nr:methylenetetrahydrofolate reductase [NAD(P)H] [Prevotella sp.]MCM1429588.1 methylenetetrahydrofolate reductase [NAD(P)H] [Clostridium sp.]MCM1476067.1 methylenetetrahydrofolate reductase [NAD(P)H] [Muribaculaceae bacterium]
MTYFDKDTHIVGVKDNIHNPAFSFEILPPLKGNSIQKVFRIIDRLKEFNPAYINITSHHSEYVYREQPDGSLRRQSVRKRPGTVAIAGVIQNKYGIPAVPHIICKGFSKEETEYALLDLNFLGVTNLLLLRGDCKSLETQQQNPELYHTHAVELQEQINNFNKGISLDGTLLEGIETPFRYGMACYPEKHEEAPNMESDLYWAKKKVEGGASYLVTQMFFDNTKYFDFVKRCRKVGITVPIIPGIKPIVKGSQLTVLPRVFRTDIPEDLARELRRCKSDEEVAQVGVEWAVEQCRDLIANGVEGLHFYTLMASESVRKIASEIY